MARLLTLYEVIKELDELPEFMDWAVNYLSRKDTLSTYTHASSVTAILDYWMLDGELPFYECGDLKRGKDILDALVYPDHKGDYQAGMESLLNAWKINPQNLLALIQQEGFAQPEFLKDLAPIESPALINHKGTEPKQGNDKQQVNVDTGSDNHKNKKLKGETDRQRTLHFIEWINLNKYDGKQTNYFLQAELRQSKPALWGSNETTFNKWLQSSEAEPAKKLLYKLKLEARKAV